MFRVQGFGLRLEGLNFRVSGLYKLRGSVTTLGDRLCIAS